MSKRVKIENVERAFMMLLVFIVVFLLILGKTMVNASADNKMTVNKMSKTDTVVAEDNSSKAKEVSASCTTAAKLEVKNAVEVEDSITEKADEVTKEDDIQNSYSSDEVILMAKLINREACYEPYEGQVAVGATVMNRLEKAYELGYNWQTITDVIKEPGQYDNGVPVESYTYNEENYNAAVEALNGVDPTNGAVYYYNPDMSDDTFIPSHILSIVIGHHWFYYQWMNT